MRFGFVIIHPDRSFTAAHGTAPTLQQARIFPSWDEAQAHAKPGEATQAVSVSQKGTVYYS